LKGLEEEVESCMKKVQTAGGSVWQCANCTYFSKKKSNLGTMSSLLGQDTAVFSTEKLIGEELIC
jgi:hypothetical protein